MEWVKVRVAAEQISIQPRWKRGRMAPHDMTMGATAVWLVSMLVILHGPPFPTALR